LVFLDQGKLDDAAAALGRRVDLRLPGRAKLGVADAADWAALAALHRRRGDHARAEPLLRQALAMHERASGREHLYTGWAACDLGELCAEIGKRDEAVALLERSRAILLRERGANDERVRRIDATLARLRV
jgi:tetratricopeptide (TPR) repeat protein